MAISKILYIGDCGSRNAGKHLKQALDYITDKEKTGEGKWTASINCQKEHAYEEMRRTKVQFGKTDKRQGYHLIISFAEDEVDAETAFELVGRFAKEYLGQNYEAAYSIHDNTDHVHGHIIFNSVSFRTGKKFRYEKGDWAKQIQPITNRLCEEYGLSSIDISDEQLKPSGHYKEWNDFRDGKYVWSDMIKRDLDACIIRSSTYEAFLSMLSGMGYEIKNAYRSEGKYLSIKPMGMTRFKRCKSLGEEYSEERIRERITVEKLSAYQRLPKEKAPGIVRCRVKRYKRAKLSGIQKRYFKKLYRTGLLKKRPYSQAWRYREDIRRMQKLQEDYLFLVRHEVTNVLQVAASLQHMMDKKKETAKEKSGVYKRRARMQPLFDTAAELEEMKEAEACYQRGEAFFEGEHRYYEKLNSRLVREGYSVEQVEGLREHYSQEIARIKKQEKAASREERIARRILEELTQKDEAVRQLEEKKENKEKDKDRQPVL